MIIKFLLEQKIDKYQICFQSQRVLQTIVHCRSRATPIILVVISTRRVKIVSRFPHPSGYQWKATGTCFSMYTRGHNMIPSHQCKSAPLAMNSQRHWIRQSAGAAINDARAQTSVKPRDWFRFNRNTNRSLIIDSYRGARGDFLTVNQQMRKSCK
jgi:hypothetical protein